VKPFWATLRLKDDPKPAKSLILLVPPHGAELITTSIAYKV
jgi:hypothetical protein